MKKVEEVDDFFYSCRKFYLNAGILVDYGSESGSAL